MTSTIIKVATEFSPSPAGRFLDDGPFPGQKFRDSVLLPAIRKFDHVTVDMTGTEMPGSSFFDEAFAGLVRVHGYSFEALNSKLKVVSPRPSDVVRVWGYIKEEDGRSRPRSVTHVG